MKKYGKFAAIIAVVLGTLTWLAVGGASENKTYYKTLVELNQMGDRAFDKRLRVAGDVEPGTIERKSGAVEFILAAEGKQLKVAYHGTEPLPDTFKDGAQALADGKLGKDGVFHAQKIQAKCASKYESKPKLAPGQQPANLNLKTS